jgi:hypothetical protein
LIFEWRYNYNECGRNTIASLELPTQRTMTWIHLRRITANRRPHDQEQISAKDLLKIADVHILLIYLIPSLLILILHFVHAAVPVADNYDGRNLQYCQDLKMMSSE